MDLGSLLLGLALLVVVGFIVTRPLFERPVVVDEPLRPADLLLADRERVLTQLRDLDFDQAMSKINAEDYAAQRAQLVAEGVAILKQLDALGVVPGQAPAGEDEIEAAVAARRARHAAAPADLEAEIEAGVAARRTVKPGSAAEVTCPKCGAQALAGDRFCARCGTPLPAAPAGLRQAKVQS
jgi:hypothetical protein